MSFHITSSICAWLKAIVLDKASSISSLPQRVGELAAVKKRAWSDPRVPIQAVVLVIVSALYLFNTDTTYGGNQFEHGCRTIDHAVSPIAVAISAPVTKHTELKRVKSCGTGAPFGSIDLAHISAAARPKLSEALPLIAALARITLRCHVQDPMFKLILSAQFLLICQLSAKYVVRAKLGQWSSPGNEAMLRLWWIELIAVVYLERPLFIGKRNHSDSLLGKRLEDPPNLLDSNEFTNSPQILPRLATQSKRHEFGSGPWDRQVYYGKNIVNHILLSSTYTVSMVKCKFTIWLSSLDGSTRGRLVSCFS